MYKCSQPGQLDRGVEAGSLVLARIQALNGLHLPSSLLSKLLPDT